MNYTLKSTLGEGGMAVVHLAEDHKFHTEVAVKMLKKEFVSNENIKKRFLAEARSMFRMSHSHVIRVSDLIDEGDTVAFVMEYVAGETLKEYLDRKGKLKDAEIKDIFSQMLDAVGYVHEQKLIHRDIKPSNFMIDKKGKVKLMDFGIAKTVDSTAAEYTQTGTGMQMGTPMYMSPEQITETKSVTAQSDIYSLGVVLWQMVTGKKPYDTKTLSNFQLQLKIVQEPLELTNTQWDGPIQRATAKDCLNRYNNSAELMQDLAAPSTAKFEDSDSTKIENVKVQFYSNESTLNNDLITIGNQIWMANNLNVDRFRNGDLISEAKTAEEWNTASQNKQPAWCYYNNDLSNNAVFGKLYNWYALNDRRGIAPNGFHIPSDLEWSTLINFLGGVEYAPNKLKFIDFWGGARNGTNDSGFSGLPGGARSYNGRFNNLGFSGYWWSFSYLDISSAINYALVADLNSVLRYNSNKGDGFSVRCIKD